MTNDFEYKGEWFLPLAKDRRVTGTLTYSVDNGISLELFGNFDDYSPILPQVENKEIIQGITRDSRLITLYRNYVIHIDGAKLIQGQEYGVPSVRYSALYMFEGVHIDKVEDITFTKIESEILYLDEWVGISGFQQPVEMMENIKKHEFHIHYKLPEPIRFTISANIEGCFNFIINIPSINAYQKSEKLEQKVKLILTSKEELPVDDFLKQLFTFQNFLILALYEKTYPKTITLYSDKFSKDYGGHSERPVLLPIKLYFHTLNSQTSEKQKLWFDMLFCYRDIKDKFPIIIEKWYKKYELLEPAFDLVFEQFYNNGRFNENTFLNLAQSAETFHARTHIQPTKNEEIKTIEKEIIKTIQEKYEDSEKYLAFLKKKFEFGDAITLQTRLKDIIDKHFNEALDKLIENKDKFIKNVKDSRNYYTHYSKDSHKKALRGHDLFYLSERLKILLVCTFLLEIGFDNDLLSSLLESKKYRFFHGLIKG
jgi:hypothetical protein